MTTTSAGPAPAQRRGVLRRRGLLRLALTLDAAVTGVNGAGYLVAAPLLADVLGLPAGSLRGVGAFLLCYSVVPGVVGTRPRISPTPVRVVVAVNLTWAAAGVAVVAMGSGTATVAGAVWIVLQALVVGGFAAAQWAGLRRLAAGAVDG